MTQRAPALSMNGGVVDAPLLASPNDMSSAVNVYHFNGRLRERGGQRRIRAVGSVTTNPYFGWGTTSVEPTAVSTLLAQPTGSQDTLWIGFASPAYWFDIYGQVSPQVGATVTLLRTVFASRRAIMQTARYWNGSAYASVDVADRFLPFRGASNSFFVATPFVAYNPGTNPWSLGDEEGMMLRGSLIPPTDWTARTINGQSRYWLTLTISHVKPSSLVLDAQVGTTWGTSNYTTTENRVKNILYFRDRSDARHEFIAYEYGAGRTEMRYELDGTNLTVGDSLQPDGTAKVFPPDQVVTSFYHKSTNRVIGCIEGFNWFYAIPGEGSIFALLPDSVGENTEYQTLLGGLRSGIPAGKVTALYDDRFWSFVGNKAFYSAPGVFADIWPNDFEIVLGDDRGDVTGVAVVGGVLVVFKRDSIWILQAGGNADEYVAYQLPGSVGCISPQGPSVNGNICYFPGEDGIYSFDGTELKCLTNRAHDWYEANVASGDASFAIGLYSSGAGQYRLFYPARGTANMCDAAVYLGVEGPQPTVWPQGRYASTDYGFRITAVGVDRTGVKERVVVGDAYGCLWELDVGHTDAGTPVKSNWVSARINIGTSKRALLRWITPTQPSDTNQNWTMYAYPEGMKQSDYRSSVSFSAAGKNPAGAFFTSNGTYSVSGTYANMFDPQTLLSGSVTVLGTWFQLEMLKTYEGPWGMDAFEFEFSPWGQRQS